LRMLRRLSIADFIITHLLFRLAEGLQPATWCNRLEGIQV
jgi:hypothetical protein